MKFAIITNKWPVCQWWRLMLSSWYAIISWGDQPVSRCQVHYFWPFLFWKRQWFVLFGITVCKWICLILALASTSTTIYRLSKCYVYYRVWLSNIFIAKVMMKVKVVKVLATQLCPTLCDSMDWSVEGSSVHGIYQARMLEWIAMSPSRGSSQLRAWPCVSRIAGRLFTIWATRETQK